jgi:hypothetical protein
VWTLAKVFDGIKAYKVLNVIRGWEAKAAGWGSQGARGR